MVTFHSSEIENIGQTSLGVHLYHLASSWGQVLCLLKFVFGVLRFMRRRCIYVCNVQWLGDLEHNIWKHGRGVSLARFVRDMLPVLFQGFIGSN